MTSVLVYSSGASAVDSLLADLQGAGFAVLATVGECSKLVQAVVRHAPDLVVADVPQLDDAFLKTLRALGEVAPLPVLLFTADTDAQRMANAVEAGVHAYAVLGYGAPRLRPLALLAQARFKREQALLKQLNDVSTRFEERKVVDRA